MHSTTIEENESYSLIKGVNDFDAINQSYTVIVEGKLEEFKPWKTGKGGGTRYFDYAIRLHNGCQVPIHNSVKIDSEYLNKKIKALGVIECGPISKTSIQNIDLKRLQSIIRIEKLK
ncbi:hypothetical protein [Nonlabens xiamenensis]|uniref:hypothetical protein n=1 Tax=Nonlabens xiamenensis TaxID=2341043 RepID=UPI000F6091E2|nr:hypothetical protein [Nonlabens xiamenensis]